MDLTNYEELILEREKLLEKREENKKRIKEIDFKIRYYEWRYSTCLRIIKINKNNINSYKKLQNYSKKNKSLFDSIASLEYNDDFYENIITDFEIKNKEIKIEAFNVSKTIDAYKDYRNKIEVENKKINIIVSKIDETINDKDIKGKVLTKGEMK